MDDLCIKCLKSENHATGVMYGQFLIDALKIGQGITIGNLLRRVLLSEIGGTSISAVRIAGTSHEFSTLPGIREDVLEILLNLKGVTLKDTTQKTKFGRLKVQGPAIVTAAQIQLPDELKIINPTHYIATIADSNVLEIEFQFDYGTSYKLATQTFKEKSNDFLEMDTIYMPVQKVNFKIKNIYDNFYQVKEQLIIEIWTNGSISPGDSITEAAKIITHMFSSITHSTFIEKNYEVTNDEVSGNIDPNTNIPIEELQLPVRAYNCLKRAQINTVGELLKYSPEQLQEIKNFGRKSADEVFAALKNKLGITLT